jgi:hypothetical protein
MSYHVHCFLNSVYNRRDETNPVELELPKTIGIVAEKVLTDLRTLKTIDIVHSIFV